MIHVKRNPKPKSLQLPIIKNQKKRLDQYYALPQAERAQTEPRFETGRLNKELKKDLEDNFSGKCAYCETLITSAPGALDHFRPKQNAMNSDGSRSSEHYWWLAFEWFNLYLSCQSCNMMKASRFPVQGERAKPNSSEIQLRTENSLLLDPCYDYPEDHLFFDEKGFIASETERGKTTIDILNLNREILVKTRFRLIQDIQALWGGLIKSIGDKNFETASQLKKYIYSPERDFLGMRRCLLQQWSLEAVERKLVSEKQLTEYLEFRTVIRKQFLTPKSANNKIELTSAFSVKNEVSKMAETFAKEQIAQDKYSLSDESQKENYFRKARFIERVEIKNFKVIEDLEINFPLDSEGKGSWLLLLGENGIGKSSVLQAVALALMGTKIRNSIDIRDASKFVTYGKDEGYIRVHLTGSINPIELKFKAKSKRFTTNTSDPKVLLLGYGATRLLPRKESRSYKGSDLIRPFNLFNPFFALKDPNRWLREKHLSQNKKQFDDAALIIKKLFMLGDDDQLMLAENQSNIEVDGPTFFGRVKLEDLSAGYQSILAMAADIMSVLANIWESIGSAEGIVLIDEIDAHLHPRWKLQIIKRLRECFPQLQFLATSHDPLTLRGLSEKEIAVMRRGNDKKIYAEVEDLPNPQALRVDQLLTSDFFGLNSTLDDELDEKFNEYYSLLALKKPNKEQKKKISAYKTELEGLNQMGNTPREKLMLEAADKYLSARKNSSKNVQLNPETRHEILNLWEKV